MKRSQRAPREGCLPQGTLHPSAFILLISTFFSGSLVDAQAPASPVVQACYPGTLWATLLAQPNVSVWSNSLLFTGLNQMLDVPTPNQALFVVRDSGLYGCGFSADIACMTQKKNWYASLTSPTAVGLLLMHWIPDVSILEHGGTISNNTIALSTFLAQAMNNTLNGTVAPGDWNINVHLTPGRSELSNPNTSSTMSRLNSLASITLLDMEVANTTLGGAAEANVVSIIPTCSGNGTLYILDQALYPNNLPQTTVNALPPLKDYCWKNVLALADDPSNGIDYLATMLTIYSPLLLNAFLDPRSNATWLVANSAASEAIGNQFASYATLNPQDFQQIATSQVLLHMLPGGFCPQYLAGRSIQPEVGLIWNKGYLLNFTYISPDELFIRNVNTDQNSTATARFLGDACYSTVYELSDNLHQWSMSNLSAVPRTTESYLTALPTVGTQSKLFGVEQTCNGTDIVQKNQSVVPPTTIKSSGSPVDTPPPPTAAAQTAAPSPPNGSSGGSLSTGGIVGIAVGASVVIIGGLLALFVWRRRRKSRSTTTKNVHHKGGYYIDPSLPKKSGSGSLGGFSLMSPFKLGPDSTGGSGGISPLNSFPLESPPNGSVDTPLLPAVPWHEFIIDSKDLQFMLNPVTHERVALGEGRFGRVYRGLLNGMEPVAVKCIEDESVGTLDVDMGSNGNGGDPNAMRRRSVQAATPRDRVMREIALLKACRSQYIVSFLGVCFQHGEIQLVMELMPGGDLWRRLHRGWGGWYAGGREVAIDVAKGLTFLHAKRVVHLDLKSSNILLRSEGGGPGGGPSGAKLTDVGLSKILPVSTEYIASAAGGTWHWAAPEVILGEKCTPAADIWSYGVVLWELCTGEAPLRGGMRPVQVPQECPQEVADLMTRCWLADTTARPTAADIVNLLSGEDNSSRTLSSSLDEAVVEKETAVEAESLQNTEEVAEETNTMHGDQAV